LRGAEKTSADAKVVPVPYSGDEESASHLEACERTKEESHMTEQDKKRKEAEQHLTDELANQAKEEPGNAAEGDAKERRAQAEKELQDAT
jgi:hypothetical protein